MNSSYQIVYWRDIPAAVKVRRGRERVNRPLPDRFQEAIDAAAMLARTTSSGDYLDEWRQSEWTEAEGEPEPLAIRLADMLAADYPDVRLEALQKNQGYE